jgi:nucleoside-diphosphate-sugar epimerase
MSRILVVGGAGYVGSVLVRELLERGYAVRVVDRLYYGMQGLREVQERVELIVADMRQAPSETFADVQAVINIGGLSNDPTAEFNPRANHEMNTEATIKLAELARLHGVRRYVFGSSCSIYDRGVDDESRDVALDETSPVEPRAAYASSKHAAEGRLLQMAGDDFCPVVLRKGTVFGFSPRMRYDLVVNTFVKDAFLRGAITLHYGGEMWRPLIDVRDAARAYIRCLEVGEDALRGQIFNIATRNVRISELALRVREVLQSHDVPVEIRPDYRYTGVRNYRVSTAKAARVLDYRPLVSVEESVGDMVERIRAYGYTDFDNPRYYNIRWMSLLEEAQKITGVTGSVFDLPQAA